MKKKKKKKLHGQTARALIRAELRRVAATALEECSGWSVVRDTLGTEASHMIAFAEREQKKLYDALQTGKAITALTSMKKGRKP